MNATRLFKYVIGLWVAIGLYACSDHLITAVTPGAPTVRLRVKSVTQQLPANTGIGNPGPLTTLSLFSYDTQGRLGSIRTFQTPDSTLGPVEQSTYQYDGQSRFTQLQRTIVTRISSQPNVSEVYRYGYNSFGQVGSIHYENSNLATFLDAGLSYTSDSRLTGSNKYYSFTPIVYQRSQTYTFTNNNLTAVSSTLQSTFLGSGTTNTTFTFDDKINPFYGVYIIPAPFVASQFPNNLQGPQGFSMYTYSGGFDNLSNLSQNNPVANSAGVVSYAYTYNSSNLPTSRITTTKNTFLNTTAVTETLLYDYETY